MLYNYYNLIVFITTAALAVSIKSIEIFPIKSSKYSLIEYPEIKYCFSSMDLLDGSQSSNYFILKRDLDKNCSHVYGNIVVSNILSGTNGSDPDLTFLSHIKEITGSLKIRNSNLSIIPLQNLRVIRGNSKLFNHDLLEGLQNSLEISWDLPISTSQTIKSIVDLRSLRSIVNGNIYISNIFCGSLANINWDELLEDPNRQTVHGKCTSSFFRCSKNCSLKNKQTFCWGPTKSQCQIFSKCTKRMCANRCFLSMNGDEECCNSQCLGGCTFSTASSCIACQGVLNGSTCQPECPQKMIINRESGVSVENKLFRPLFINVCVSKCPDGLLEQEGECKSQCTFRKYERKGNKCVPCKKFCEQICTVEDIYSEKEIKYSFVSLDAVKIKKLEKCTTFKGSLQIDKESFMEHSHLPDNIPLTNAADLWYLNNLRNISGSIYIDMEAAQFKLNNLSFFSNLQVIEGHHGDIPTSLGIFNTNISFIGLTSLKYIGLKGLKNKPILLKNNINLCYFDKEKLKRVLNFEDFIYTSELPDPKWCEKQGKVCSDECDPSLGCWGPGPSQCSACKNMKLGKLCAQNCLAEPGFLPNPDPNTRICLKCHEECAKTCSGIKSNQCINGCKHAMENGHCVPHCSRTHYFNVISKTCEPCNQNCHSRNITRLQVCTGALSKPGPGGCNKCQSLILDINGTAQKCVNQMNLNGYFSENHPNTANSQFSNFTEKFTDLIVTYRPCHPLCKRCTFVTDQRIIVTETVWNGCVQCNGFWLQNQCVFKCPLNKTYTRVDKSNSSQGNCLTCHHHCQGCYGDGNDKCIKCNNFRLSDNKNLSQFSCVEQCPPNHEYENFNEKLNERKCVFVLLSKLEYILVIVAMIFFLVLLIFIIIITKIFHTRKEKRRSEKAHAHASNINEKDSADIKEISPNMNQLIVIPNDDLECYYNEILGKGTFGSVYAGRWKPGAKYFDDTTSMNSCKDQKVDVVVKLLNNACDQDEFMEEVKIMASVRHKHCLRLIGVSYKDGHKLLISSFMPLGSMDKYLANNKKNLTGRILLLWAEQIANGMVYLEINHIIHRDLATRNVLIYKETHVQITDFGLSKVMKSSKDEIKIFGGMVPVRWLAIETLREGIYSSKTDVWAFAVTLWEIFTFAKVPYGTIKAHEIRDEIIKGTRLCQPEICSLDIYILMLKCWSIDPLERPNFEYLWGEFKMYCKNSETYLSHPNIEPRYRKSSTEYTDIRNMTDDRLSIISSQSGKPTALSSVNINKSNNKSKHIQSPLIIPDNIRPLLSKEPKRNVLYEPAFDLKTSNMTLNGSFNKSNGYSNFQVSDYSTLPGSSPSIIAREYLEPLTTQF